MSIKHAFTSAKDDGADTTLVRPVNWNAAHTGFASTGTYTGDSTENRAIAHGLGVIPSLVVIISASGGAAIRVYNNSNIQCISAGGAYAVTLSDTTNFYVGDAVSYHNTANIDTYLYIWIAIG